MKISTLLFALLSLGAFLASSVEAQSPSPTPAPAQTVAAVVAVPAAAASPVAPSLRDRVGQPLSHFDLLTIIVGYLLITIIGLLGFLILWRIYTGKIDISLVISEGNGAASLSRLQFLIFTFVISLSLLLVILGKEGGPGFPPTIPAGIYALLGISAASYVVSKGIQANVDKSNADDYRVRPDNENAG
ncbi:MAG: hypothetical protein M3032_07030 [Verrucomicrobiota bacterium]|nr:hypothetical protein [Verrucomicrobiota bacterium]